MSAATWLDILGWNREQADEVRDLAFSYLREGHYKLALVFFEGLVGLEQVTPVDRQALGALYLELNRPQEAIEWLDRALEDDPMDVAVMLNKAKALLRNGEKEAGLELAEKLTRAGEEEIANVAEALLMAYRFEKVATDSVDV